MDSLRKQSRWLHLGCSRCAFLYNSISFGLLKESQKVRNLGVNCLRLNFTTESPEQSADILQEFLNVYLHGKTPGNQEYTKGHFKRGAE